MTRKITFLRHGHSVAPEGVQQDKARRLSDKGRQQAQKRREQFGNPEFDLIITSQIVRTAETALEVAGSNTSPVVMLYEMFTPHSGPQYDALHRLFDKLGHKSLSAYYADDPTDVEQMKKFGRIGWEMIVGEIANNIISNSDCHVLVVGHGMYSTCMVNAASPEKTEYLMDLVQGECDGFVVTLDGHNEILNVEPLPSLE